MQVQIKPPGTVRKSCIANPQRSEERKKKRKRKKADALYFVAFHSSSVFTLFLERNQKSRTLCFVCLILNVYKIKIKSSFSVYVKKKSLKYFPSYKESGTHGSCSPIVINAGDYLSCTAISRPTFISPICEKKSLKYFPSYKESGTHGSCSPIVINAGDYLSCTAISRPTFISPICHPVQLTGP